MPMQSGSIRVFGHDVAAHPLAARRQMGVLFQSPALDKQLTVAENIAWHGRLYGLSGKEITTRLNDLLTRLGIADRAKEFAGKLSGGMRRKVELAKALLPRPKLLLLDEPSTGLDVAARIDFWQLLHELRQQTGLSILLTTHLMDEADRCDRLTILEQGKAVAQNTPDALKRQISGDIITLTSADPDDLQKALRERLHIDAVRVDQTLRFERAEAHLFVPHVVTALPGLIDSIAVTRPSLDDVFVRLTGRRLDAESQFASASSAT
jgi:ABC-2 type transport system ATP-binding protein